MKKYLCVISLFFVVSINAQDIDKLFNQLDSIKNDSIKVSLINDFSVNLPDSINLNSRIAIFNKIIDYGEQKVDSVVLAKALVEKAIFNQKLGKIKISEKILQKAENYFKDRSKLPILRVKMQILAGNNHYYKRQYDKALKHYYIALNISEKNNYHKGELRSVNNIASIFFIKERYKEALYYYKRNYRLGEKFSDSIIVNISLNNIVRTYLNEKNIDSAKFYTKIFSKQINKQENHELKDQYYVYLSNILFLEKKFSKANRFINMALKNNPENYFALELKGKISEHRKQYKEAENSYKKSITFAEKYANTSFLIELYNTVSTFYKKQRNYKQSNIYLHKLINIRKSNHKNTKKVFNLLSEYEKKEKEKQIFLQNIKLKKKELQNTYNSRLLFMAILFFIFLAIITFIYFDRRKLNYKYAVKLEEIKERNDIAKDLHDNFGSSLTYIISSIDTTGYEISDKDKGQIVENISKIKQFTARTIIFFRNYIWALSEPSYSYKEIKERITLYIFKTQSENSKTNIHFTSLVPDDLIIKSKSALAIINASQRIIYAFLSKSENVKVEHSLHKTKNIIFITIAGNSDVNNSNCLKIIKSNIDKMNGRIHVISHTDYSTVRISFKIATIKKQTTLFHE